MSYHGLFVSLHALCVTVNIAHAASKEQKCHQAGNRLTKIWTPVGDFWPVATLGWPERHKVFLLSELCRAGSPGAIRNWNDARKVHKTSNLFWHLATFCVSISDQVEQSILQKCCIAKWFTFQRYLTWRRNPGSGPIILLSFGCSFDVAQGFFESLFNRQDYSTPVFFSH